METKRCPYCGEEIRMQAIKCKHCGEWLTEAGKKIAESKEKKETKWESKQRDEEKESPLERWIFKICFYLLVVGFWGGIALLFHYTIPSDERMERAIINDMQDCVKDKATSYTNLIFGSEIGGLASLFFDSGVSDESIAEQFHKNNAIHIEKTWLWSVGKISNRNTYTEGATVCFGILGIVVPFVEWDDFVLMDEN